MCKWENLQWNQQRMLDYKAQHWSESYFASANSKHCPLDKAQHCHSANSKHRPLDKAQHCPLDKTKFINTFD